MSCVTAGKGDGEEACANCGKHGSDTVKLKNCTACRLVKYCGVDCQKAHRKQHKKACKQRAAELEDEQLYKCARNDPGTGTKEGSGCDFLPRGGNISTESSGCKRTCERQSNCTIDKLSMNCTLRLRSLVRLKDWPTLVTPIFMGMGFKRTRQRLPNSSKRRPYEDMLRVGTSVAVSKD